MYINKKIIPLPAVNILLILSIKLWSLLFEAMLQAQVLTCTHVLSHYYISWSCSFIPGLQNFTTSFAPKSLWCLYEYAMRPFEKNNKEKMKSDI